MVTTSEEEIAMFDAAAEDHEIPAVEAEADAPWVHPSILKIERLTDVTRYTIYVERGAVSDFEAEIEKLNKLIRRHGSAITIVERSIVETKDWLDRRRDNFHYVIDAPAVAGEKAKLAGTFELAEDNESIYTVVLPGYEEAQIAAFKPRWQECDHCHADRKRHASFVCEREDGTFVVIGRNCSRAYLGISPADLLARAAVARMIEGKDEDEEGFFGFRTSMFNVEEKVREAYRVAKHLGGYSKETRSLFEDHMRALRGAKDDGYPWKYAKIREEYEGKPIPEINLVDFADYVESATGDFGENLRIALGCEYAKLKRAGIVIAGTGLYVGRALKRERDAAARADLPTAKHIEAPIGKRVDLVATVIKTRPYESMYGAGMMIQMRAADGSNAIQFTSGENTPEAGKTYAIRGTIKKHDKDKRTGEPQTMLSRCIFKEVLV